MITKRKPHNLLLRDAPDERDLSVVRQFHNNNNMFSLRMSIIFTTLNKAIEQ